MCKIRVYLSKINHHLCQDMYDDLLQVISKENRERCQRFRRTENALHTLYGELILRHVLIQQFALKNDEIEILKEESGKPYVKGTPIHYNISHSRDYVVCAFSEQAVGIDIQWIKEVDLKIAKKYFCNSECDDLFAQPADQQADDFATLWTLKESYIKWSGKGMSKALDSFCFKIENEKTFVTDMNLETTPFFKHISLDGYKIALCSMMGNFEVEMEDICVEDMQF